MISNFNKIYESVITSILKEGGNAFSDVERIKQQEINSVVTSFKKNIIDVFLGFDPKESMFLIGSTGKKPDSGDIDIALDVNILKDNVLVSLMKIDQLCAESGIQSYINTINFNMLHIRYPKSNNKFVQIDLLLTKCPEFTKFFMYSPSLSESRYKGAHRNTLLHSILFVTSMKPIQFDKNNNLVKWVQNDITDVGIFKQQKTLVDEYGNRLFYKNTTEFLEFEYAKIENSILIENNKENAIKMMVGNNFDEKDIDTFEKLFEIVLNNKNFKYRCFRHAILKECAKNLKLSEKRLIFPSELNNYL